MTTTSNATHPFEKAGLGKAPFRYIGSYQEPSGEVRRECPKTGLTMITKGGTSCDYCGTYILTVCRIKSADGKEFKVGCDCVAKVDSVLNTKVKRDVAKRTKERNQDRIQDFKDRLQNIDFRAALAQHEHPRIPNSNLTLLDYAEWILKNAGVSGSLKMIRAVEKTLKG